MLIVKKLLKLKNILEIWRKENKSIALVPTMGNIHDGHLKLISIARKNSDILIVSVFVNPMQFENIKDISNYPRTLNEDCQKLKKNLVNLMFIPEINEMYPYGLTNQTIVNVPKLSYILEGIHRPGHFQGVTTIISKLFNLIKPNIAYFGEKDFQQLVIIRKMVIDMNFDIKIVGIPTVRNQDGLALSSRNIKLNEYELKVAANLNKVMNYMAHQLINIEFNIHQIIKKAKIILVKNGLQPDGLAICDELTLKKLTTDSKNAAILVAAKIGNTRLIDYKKVKLQ
ncbi:pantoate--beta-alanine ligase [Candidatus Pantoea edessiphila]|uniref:Pantothenate synthetase n=1 Tax=Candidatus Pantoea edessiphila TaxID=2044610 RepID=A0A2P5T097_9GAMM|nr:pantoate--beta-alanine ligase [Candidatus Pantoea edessiphila]PPI87986.1 pantoate--beta-alanine ligase [Candidatus Pantoea edessiphila]